MTRGQLASLEQLPYSAHHSIAFWTAQYDECYDSLLLAFRQGDLYGLIEPISVDPNGSLQFNWWYGEPGITDFTIALETARLPVPISTPTPAPISTPAPAKVGITGVRFESGIIGGTRVTVPQGSEVDVYVTLESTAPTEGLLEVLVLRDIILDEDQGKKLCTNRVILSAGSQEIQGCDFLADDLTTGTLRQYYIQVSWNSALIYDPTDPNTREFVLTEPAPVAVPTPTPTPALFVTPTEVTFRWVYQPNGSTDLVNGISSGTTTLGVLQGLIFDPIAIAGSVADIYYADPSCNCGSTDSGFWANNGTGGVHDLGNISFVGVSTASDKSVGVGPSQYYDSQESLAVVGHVYVIVTKDGAHYAKLVVDSIA